MTEHIADRTDENVVANPRGSGLVRRVAAATAALLAIGGLAVTTAGCSAALASSPAAQGPATGGQKSYLLHYSGGHLTAAALPGGPFRISVDTVALIPGTTSMLASGVTYAFAHPGANLTAVLLQFGR